MTFGVGLGSIIRIRANSLCFGGDYSFSLDWLLGNALHILLGPLDYKVNPEPCKYPVSSSATLGVLVRSQ